MLVPEELLRRAQSGDPAAFEAIVDAYRTRVRGKVARLIGSAANASVVSDLVFSQLHGSVNQLSSAAFDPWLYRLTLNASHDYLRKHPLGN